VIPQDEDRFERYLEGNVRYVEAVKAAEVVPWFENPEKLARLEERIPGISQMPAKERRRALFNRHRTQPEAPAV
jgi:hypothetical protein